MASTKLLKFVSFKIGLRFKGSRLKIGPGFELYCDKTQENVFPRSLWNWKSKDTVTTAIIPFSLKIVFFKYGVTIIEKLKMSKCVLVPKERLFSHVATYQTVYNYSDSSGLNHEISTANFSDETFTTPMIRLLDRRRKLQFNDREPFPYKYDPHNIIPAGPSLGVVTPAETCPHYLPLLH